MATSQPEAPARKLRWFQYSLRSLLLFTLLVSVGMSWVAVKIEQARRQKEAVEEIRKLGGLVRYDYQVHQPGRTLLRGSPPGPAWLRNFLGEDFFATVVGVSLNGSPITDAGLEHLRGLKRLQALSLQHTKVTDGGLEHLMGLAQLQFLDLWGTKVAGAGLEHLKGLTQLHDLRLNHTHVSDTGLEHLKGLAQLQGLYLGGTAVTDSGLKNLKGLAQLKVLVLDDTHVTNEGVKRLQQALPNCYVAR